MNDNADDTNHDSPLVWVAVSGCVILLGGWLVWSVVAENGLRNGRWITLAGGVVCLLLGLPTMIDSLHEWFENRDSHD